jgi:hypothetical protein
MDNSTDGSECLFLGKMRAAGNGTQQTMERMILPLIVRPLYTLIAASRNRGD